MAVYEARTESLIGGEVGSGVERADEQVTHFIASPTIDSAVVEVSFTAAEVDSDRIPALLGVKSLTMKRCILDFDHDRLIVPGPNGVEMRCSSGTTGVQAGADSVGTSCDAIQRFREGTDVRGHAFSL